MLLYYCAPCSPQDALCSMHHSASIGITIGQFEHYHQPPNSRSSTSLSPRWCPLPLSTCGRIGFSADRVAIWHRQQHSIPLFLHHSPYAVYHQDDEGLYTRTPTDKISADEACAVSEEDKPWEVVSTEASGLDWANRQPLGEWVCRRE